MLRRFVLCGLIWAAPRSLDAAVFQLEAVTVSTTWTDDLILSLSAPGLPLFETISLPQPGAPFMRVLDADNAEDLALAALLLDDTEDEMLTWSFGSRIGPLTSTLVRTSDLRFEPLAAIESLSLAFLAAGNTFSQNEAGALVSRHFFRGDLTIHGIAPVPEPSSLRLFILMMGVAAGLIVTTRSCEWQRSR